MNPMNIQTQKSHKPFLPYFTRPLTRAIARVIHKNKLSANMKVNTSFDSK